MKNVKILEIDNNNSSNVFHNSTMIDSVSVKVDGAEEAFSDLLFEQMANGAKIVVDLGGGDDSRAGLKIIKNTGIKFTYLIPVGNSLAQLQNAYDTYNLIGNAENTIFILNQATSVEKVKDDFLFWFGSEKYGINPFINKLDNPKTIVLPRTPLFELSAMVGITIYELAQFSNGISKEKSIGIFFKESNGDREIFKSLKRKYDQSILAKEYLDGVVSQFKELTKGTKNIAVISTKGGVGKSTIAWHIAGLIME